MKAVARAGIIAVGSELLTPFKVDTNSLFITEQLNRLGIDVVAKAVVGDDRGDLAHFVQSMLDRVDLLITSGGLGPTDDDVTREVVAEVLERPLTEDTAMTAQLRERFLARGFPQPMPEINRRQAMVPAGARLLANLVGSAPGLLLEHQERLVVLLPGPPRELQPMLSALIETGLRAHAVGIPIARRALRIAGRIESQVDELLQPIYREWSSAPMPVAATILSAPGSIELHLSVRASSQHTAVEALDAAVGRVLSVLGADVYSSDGRSLEEVVGGLLVARHLRIGLAESCTGGLIASRLTDVPGSSRYLDGAVVAYANAAKTEWLGVTPDLLRTHGAVSEQVAVAMAGGIRSRAGVDVGVGVTGIAGPDGGSLEKPVGTVAIAVVTPDGSRSRVHHFRGDRQLVKFQASQAALDMTRRMLAEG